MERSIAELVAGAKQNDQLAANELYSRTAKRAYSVARQSISDEDQIATILQEAYVKAFCGLDSLGDPAEFEPWLDRIVLGQCEEYLRKAKPEPFTKMDEAPASAALPEAPASPSASCGVPPVQGSAAGQTAAGAAMAGSAASQMVGNTASQTAGSPASPAAGNAAGAGRAFPVKMAVIAAVGVLVLFGGGKAIRSSGPKHTVKKLEEAMNDKDLEGMINCIDPSSQKKIRSYYNAAGFLAGAVGLSLPDDLGAASELLQMFAGDTDWMKVDMDVKDIDYTGRNRADVTVKMRFRTSDGTEDSTETLPMEKVEGDWYISMDGYL